MHATASGILMKNYTHTLIIIMRKYILTTIIALLSTAICAEAKVTELLPTPKIVKQTSSNSFTLGRKVRINDESKNVHREK